MVLTASTMLELGTGAPPFDLPDVSTGKHVKLSDSAGKNLLVMFICKHCPYVKHIKDELGRIGKDYSGKKDFSIVAISSNDADTYPDDSPASLKAFASEAGLTYPLLYDESQAVAKAYTAACTPDFFLFDSSHNLVYRGQLDDGRPGNNEPVNGKDLRQAIDLLLQGAKISETQKPSTGCNIKWKAGQAPGY
jgi:peroxiredoxin